MSTVKDFFKSRVFLNCLLFSAVISTLFTLRYTHLRNIPFFSSTTGKVYIAFVIADFLVLLIVFFILHLLARRSQQD